MTDILVRGKELYFGKIKASTRTTHLFGMLKGKTHIGPEAWARVALCLSIKQKGIPNPDEYNTDGTEFLPSRLFPNNQNLYLALMVNRLKQDKLDPKTDLDEMTRAHLNRGAIALKQRINTSTDIYRFMDEMKVNTLRMDIKEE